MKSAITLRKLSVHVFSNLLKLKDNNNKYNFYILQICLFIYFKEISKFRL